MAPTAASAASGSGSDDMIALCDRSLCVPSRGRIELQPKVEAAASTAKLKPKPMLKPKRKGKLSARCAC